MTDTLTILFCILALIAAFAVLALSGYRKEYHRDWDLYVEGKYVGKCGPPIVSMVPVSQEYPYKRYSMVHGEIVVESIPFNSCFEIDEIIGDPQQPSGIHTL